MKATKQNVPYDSCTVRIYVLGELEQTGAYGRDIYSLERLYAEAVTIAMEKTRKDGLSRQVVIEQVLVSTVVTRS